MTKILFRAHAPGAAEIRVEAVADDGDAPARDLIQRAYSPAIRMSNTGFYMHAYAAVGFVAGAVVMSSNALVAVGLLLLAACMALIAARTAHDLARLRQAADANAGFLVWLARGQDRWPTESLAHAASPALQAPHVAPQALTTDRRLTAAR